LKEGVISGEEGSYAKTYVGEEMRSIYGALVPPRTEVMKYSSAFCRFDDSSCVFNILHNEE